MMKHLYITIALTLLTHCSEDSTSVASEDSAQNLLAAERLVDAFYSFDPAVLAPLLGSASDSSTELLYYQGWAEGGNYRILDRRPCATVDANTVSCSITVDDDPMLALGIDHKVTDTFTIEFAGAAIVAVTTSSDDLPIYYAARDWVMAHNPELIAAPCEGFFAGGTTPGACAQAMTAGYEQFAASEEFKTHQLESAQ